MVRSKAPGKKQQKKGVDFKVLFIEFHRLTVWLMMFFFLNLAENKEKAREKVTSTKERHQHRD